MNRRVGDERKKSPSPNRMAGPVITLSREVGCGGIAFASLLAEELNKAVYCKKWQVVSKEVLHASANELQVHPEKVHRVFSREEHTTFDEILSAFSSKYYKSNRTITKTVREVIRNFACDGCCIIVGRAGHLIADDIENALHVRLVAPIRWRVDSLMVRKKLEHADALKYIKETDKERTIFRDHFRKNKHEEERFDLVVDISRFEIAQVVKIVLAAFEARGINERLKKTIPHFG